MVTFLERTAELSDNALFYILPKRSGRVINWVIKVMVIYIDGLESPLSPDCPCTTVPKRCAYDVTGCSNG